MKVWYVVPVFVFLHYMSVEYLLPLCEGLEYVESDSVQVI